MKNRTRAFFTLILIISLMVSQVGCATYKNFKDTFIDKENVAKTIQIGVFEPMSGELKETGKLEIQGIELAHELFPEIIGKKVELVYADNQSDVDVAEMAAKNLVDQKVSVVLGSSGSTLSLVGGEFFKEAEIPAIAITATNPLVTSSSDYYFRTCFVDSFQGIALAKYVVEEKDILKAAILRDTDDDYAAAVSQTFSDKMVQLTEDENAIISTIEYKANKKDFKPQLKQLKDLGAQVILLASKNNDAINIMKQAHEMNYDVIFLGSDNWDSESFVKQGGEALEGCVFSTLFDPNAGITQNSEVFLKAYKEKYGKDKEPESEVALGFDAYLLAINAIGSAGTSVNGEAIKEKLAQTKEFQGASGKITFDANGDPIKSVVLKTITNGEFVHIYTVEPTWQ